MGTDNSRRGHVVGVYLVRLQVLDGVVVGDEHHVPVGLRDWIWGMLAGSGFSTAEISSNAAARPASSTAFNFQLTT
jgi:hypothetical protein